MSIGDRFKGAALLLMVAVLVGAGMEWNDDFRVGIGFICATILYSTGYILDKLDELIKK